MLIIMLSFVDFIAQLPKSFVIVILSHFLSLSTKVNTFLLSISFNKMIIDAITIINYHCVSLALLSFRGHSIVLILMPNELNRRTNYVCCWCCLLPIFMIFLLSPLFVDSRSRSHAFLLPLMRDPVLIMREWYGDTSITPSPIIVLLLLLFFFFFSWSYRYFYFSSCCN